MDSHDYSAAANVWQRVNPQETPYPEAGRGRFEGGMVPAPPQQTPNRPTTPSQPMQPSMPPAVRPMPMPPGGSNNGQEMYRALLREEMRHLQQVISVLEKALA